MNVTAYVYSNQGGRDHNEDAVRAFAENGLGVFVLADGLGGHGCGEVASALAADALLEKCRQDPPVDGAAFAELLKAANEAVLEGQKKPGREDMRTTAVALSLSGDTACWAWIGDSRLYRFSGGEVAPLIKDHSVTYRKYLGGEITYMDIPHDDDRSRLLRCLGKLPCQPEGGQCVPQPGDAFLLCSDGFWEFVYDTEMLADWLKSETPEEWARRMLLRHIQRTPPENDNFSLIAVFVEEDP